MAQQNKIEVSLVGNPNSGKSSLFNELTGLNQKIANYPGVTVEKKSGNCTIYDERNLPVTAHITDLPGTYSLFPKSPDERIPFKVLCDQQDESHPQIIIVIADGTNLKRSLFLCSQVIDLKIPVILAINMMDLVNASGLKIDTVKLSDKLGIPVIGINARKGEGIDELKRELSKPHQIRAEYFHDCRPLAPELLQQLQNRFNFKSAYQSFLIAGNFDELKIFNESKAAKIELEKLLVDFQFEAQKFQSIETLERYKIIAQVMADCVTNPVLESKNTFTHKLDKLLTHRIWGFVFFLLILFVIFQAIFTWAKYPMDFVDYTFSQFSQWLAGVLPVGILNDLIVNGVLAGLAGVLIFIPQIALLFAFIAILEDTGYMARVSFIMDKLMRKFGLDGRSVIPLISGVACAVPAIMSTRTIQSWKDRLITIMVTPLMSCAARLPVYTLLISLIIPDKNIYGVINAQGLVLMMLYLIGFFAALTAALVMKYIIKTKEKTWFIMEIPVYRMPRWNNILFTIYDKVKLFIIDAGKVIIAISIILWVLSSFGPSTNFNAIEKKYSELRSNPARDSVQVEKNYQTEKLESSYAGIMGRWLEPAIEPLGYDWKIGIALITSFAAREVFVGTMSTIYSVGGDNENVDTVRDKMSAEINPKTGKPVYNLATGLSLMLFYAFAMQCMSTIAVVKRETGGWKIPLIQFLYMGALAYFASLLIYNIFK